MRGDARRRPGTDPGRGAGHRRAAGRLPAAPRLAGGRRRQPYRPLHRAPNAAGARGLRGAHLLLRRHRDGLGDRRRPAPGGGRVPQQRDPCAGGTGDRRARAGGRRAAPGRIRTQRLGRGTAIA